MEERKFSLITKMWAPLALEYAKFLNRYNLETVAIITGRTFLGCEISVFADEEKYLELTENNTHFNQEEAHITDLINVIWNTTEMLCSIPDDEYEDEDDFYDEQEYDYIDYDDEEE